MSSVQTSDEIAATLRQIDGRQIALLQVLGINSLKTTSPTVHDLVGQVIEGSDVVDRVVTLRTVDCLVRLDLQRTGRVVWRESTEPFRLAAGPMPTLRLITDGGTIDFAEPAKTKRITVHVETRHG